MNFGKVRTDNKSLFKRLTIFWLRNQFWFDVKKDLCYFEVRRRILRSIFTTKNLGHQTQFLLDVEILC